MADAEPKLAVPGGVEAPELQVLLSEVAAPLALLRSIVQSEMPSRSLREDAASLVRDAHAAFEERPTRVRVIGATSEAAWTWVHGSLGLAVTIRPGTLVAWRSEQHVLDVLRADGACFDLDGLSPDPGPGIRASLTADEARAADVEAVRVSVRVELDTAVASHAERAERRAAVEAELGREREALASAQARVRELQEAQVPADAYLAACTTTVPAVLRRDPAGLWDRMLQAVLPLLFSADLRAWRSAVAKRDSLDSEEDMARIAAGETETRLVRLRRERVALMNETVRLQGEVSRLRAECAALETERETVQARVEASRAALAALPAERAAAWAAALEAHGGAPETRTLRIAGPDLPLPEGLAICVGPDEVGDVELVLEGGVPEQTRDATVQIGLGSGRLEDLRDRAVRRHVLAAASRIGARSHRLAASLAAEMGNGPRRDASDRAALQDLETRWSGALVAEVLAEGADARVRASERMLQEACAGVPQAMAGVWEAVVAPLAELDEAAAVGVASARLAGEVQVRVDRAVQTILTGLAAEVMAWLATVIGAAATAENGTLVALGGTAVEAPLVGRVSLVGVVPEMVVAAATGNVEGPLLTLRDAGDLRAEATASVRAAVDQATVQLQARLMGPRVPLCSVLERGVAVGLEGLCDRLEEARLARMAALEDGAEAREAARRDLAAMADVLATHARALAERPGGTEDP